MRTPQEYTQEIAQQCGKLIPTDDPLMMLHTFLAVFCADQNSQQMELLKMFQSGMETEFSKWDEEVTTKANRIITASLEAAKKASVAQFDEQATALKTSVDSLIEAHKAQAQSLYTKSYHLAVANMITAGLLAVTAMFIFLR